MTEKQIEQEYQKFKAQLELPGYRKGRVDDKVARSIFKKKLNRHIDELQRVKEKERAEEQVREKKRKEANGKYFKNQVSEQSETTMIDLNFNKGGE